MNKICCAMPVVSSHGLPISSSSTNMARFMNKLLYVLPIPLLLQAKNVSNILYFVSGYGACLSKVAAIVQAMENGETSFLIM